MFKDYYLILGISIDATSEEIEKAFEDGVARLKGKTSSMEFYDTKEAFEVLSHQDIRIKYDKELKAYNNSDDFENYEIKDPDLESIISSIQTNLVNSENTSHNYGSIITKGCMLVLFVIFMTFFQTCISAIMKQKGRNAVKNSYSYVIPQNK